MRDRIEAGKSEQLVGAQQAKPNGPSFTKLSPIQPERAKDGKSSGNPNQKAAGQPGERSRLGRSGPQNAPDDRRRELRGRYERDEPDGDEGIGLADEPHIGIAEQHDDHDGAAPDRQQDAGQIATLRQMQAADSQQRRHDEVVAHHGAERHRLDNDHAGRGGKSADEGKQRDRLLTLGHRQGQHERVGVHASLREVEQAAEGDGQHEDIDEEKIEREQPDRLL